MYKIEIDRSLCSGFGTCAELAPACGGWGAAAGACGESIASSLSRYARLRKNMRNAWSYSTEC